MIKILLFAYLQEEIGKDSLSMETDGCSVQQVKNYIHTHYPTTNLDQVMAAVNEEFSFDEDVVKDGDVIAFLPPVSGG
ncbi:molybdopterin converting factor subunit 1 [Rummeliibacillus suwonensis]|jgi:molybdopterin synthase subunit MoaD|uniref:molybdopterin converting factor subunit 1 n=1 Tax=Rummeliibacillus suwonensis TaxID=1306154 RepID=UPI001AAE605E|nr:molybdopterin converting factor subunit 1 [Rummeliibacillus suwonensis]MBO2537681.1 molybdopterin converting factor subunit 1 [Rummeliibacillus suwonensis]